MNDRTPAEHPSLVTHEAAHWHALQRAGGLTPQQQAQFMDWLVASPLHLREYLVMQRVADELSGALRAMAIDMDAPRAPLRDNVVALPLRARPVATAATARRPRPAALARVVGLAATLACVALLANTLWPRERHYAAAPGTPRTLVLDDGSRVHLAGDSELAVRIGVLQRRLELRRGQASFEVATDRRPFDVRAAGLRIEDIGTVFDVALLRERARIEVAQGRVKVWDARADTRAPLADLRAGQRARIAYADHATAITREDPQGMTAWWDGRIVFRDETLQDVAERFNRLNRTQLRIDDAAAGTLRLTGNLRADDIDSLLAYLRDQPSLDVRRDGERLHVRRRVAAAMPPARL